MRAPWTTWRPLRVEAALNDPSQAPAWQDISAWAAGSGARITRGTARRRDGVRPGGCQLDLRNDDSTFSGSLYRKPFRVAYRHPLPGNLLSANAASFETSTAAWATTTFFGAYTPCTVAQSSVRAVDGSKSMLLTWPTTAGGSLAVTTVDGLVIGRRYQFSAWVYVPAGHPDVRLEAITLFTGPWVTTKGQWVKTSAYWVADRTSVNVFGVRVGAATAGQQCWVDAVMVDEADVPAEVITRTNISRTTTYNVTLGTVTATPGVSYAGKTWTRITIGATPLHGIRNVATLSDLVNGQTYTGSWEVANDSGSALPITLDWCDTLPTATYTLAPGEVRRVSVTGSRATYDNTFRFVDLALNTPNTSILIREAMINPGADTGPYFDGDTPNTNFFHRWTGTPGASPSEEYTPGLGPFTTDPPPISYRFTGRAMTNDVEFPAPGRSDAPVVLADELAWQTSDFRPFIDVPGQEILSRGPLSLFRLNGDLGDQVPGGKPLAPAGNGAAPTESLTVMSSASSAVGTAFSGGQRLEGSLTSAAGSFFSTGLTVTALVRTTSTGTVLAIGDKFGDTLTLAITAGGVTATTTNQFNPAVNMTTATSSPVNDGQPHVITARWRNDDTLSVHVDAAAPVSTTLAGGWSAHRRANVIIAVGGNRYGATFTGSIANVAAFDQPLSDAVIAEFGSAVLTGFLGESAQDRLARYNRWAGSPFAIIDAAGATSQVGHYDTEGKGLVDAVGAVATVEDGITYVRGDGALVLKSRVSFIAPSVVFTVTGPLGGDQNNIMRDTVKLSVDPTRAVNDVTGTRPGGGSQRVINSASQAKYGQRTAQVDGPFATDAAMASVLEWIVNTESDPTRQVEGLSVRLSQLNDYQTLQLLAADLGSTVGWSGLPSQATDAAAGTAAVFGLEETYSSTDLLWSAQVQPNPGVDVWIIEDPVYGALDSTHRIAY